MAEEKQHSSGSSFFGVISSRIDAAAPLIGKGLVAGALIWAFVSIFWLIIPNSHQQQDIQRRLERRSAEVTALKAQATQLYQFIDAMDDPYYLDQYARARYGFVEAAPTPETVSSKRTR